MESFTIREVLDTVLRGQLRIPAFQRGFVWEPDRVAYLMDSIYKGFPFGSLLFWRTKEQLKSERSLGPFDLPDPNEDYPVDYVLDGQQRITSIFGAFQTDLPAIRPELWRDIYYDFRADANAQETQFFAPANHNEVDPNRHFPLKTLFDTAAYRKATAGFSDELAKRIDDMQSIFKEVRIPIQLFKTEDKATVAIIFERVNRQGVPLDTLQLLSAWTWSEDFQLQNQFADLAEQLVPFGFKDLGGDSNLLLRCCSAILKADASPDALMNLHGSEVRERFSEVLNGVRGAIDFLQSNFNVHAFDYLPLSTILVPLSVFFAAPGTTENKHTEPQRKALVRWFWRTCFAKRYSGGVLRNLNADIIEMNKLKEGKPSALGGFAVNITKSFFLDNVFTTGTTNTATFILLLAQKAPLSFISGTPVDLKEKLSRANRAEFHHLMPKAFLVGTGQSSPPPNCLANFTFLSRAENRDLGGVAPSKYQAKMAASPDVLTRALCPPSLFSDQFSVFANERAEILQTFANELCL